MQTIVLGVGPYLLGVVGALLVVRAPGMAPWAVIKDAGPRARRRSRAVLGLILAGLMTIPFRIISSNAYAWILFLRSPGGPPEIPTRSLLVALGTSMGVVAAFIVAWWLFRQIDWAGLGMTTGWHATFWQRLFLWLGFGIFLAWPITVPLQIIAVALSASNVPADAAGRHWVGIAQSVIGHGLGLWVAGGILRQVADQHARVFKSGSQRVTLVLLIALTGILAQGVLHLFDLFNRIVESIAPGPAGAPSLALTNPASAHLILNALPALAYLLAALVLRRIDWNVVEGRSGWRPSALDEVLIFLALGVWLAWPFDLLQVIAATVLPAVLLGFTLMLQHVAIAGVALIVLYLVFLYSPGSAREESEMAG